MKRTCKLFSVLLAIVMLLPCFAMPIWAEDEIVNLYDESLAGDGMAPKYTYDETLDKSYEYHTSHVIGVREGDTITVGPILENSQWFIRAYNEDGKSVKMISYNDCEWGDNILDNVKICTYTIPTGVKYIRVMNSQAFYDCTLISKNRVFTRDEYFAYMDRNGINVDLLRPTNDEKELENLFPAYSDETLRGYVSLGQFTENYYYRSREYTEFERGDVIYFAAANQENKYFVDVVYEDGTTAAIPSSHLVLYEDLEREYAIYAYRVRPGVKKVAINLGTGVYDDGITLVTRNQPFTGEKYREMFGIDLNEDILDETSPLYGLKGLFIGDSISRGGHDYLSYLDQSKEIKYRLAWAGGLAVTTGLIATNASVSSARISYRESKKDSDLWIYNQMVPYFRTGSEFDLVVMHGGVNDCPSGRHAVGEPLPVTASEAELEAALKATVTDNTNNNTGEELTSYAAGFQWTVYNAKKNFPNAELFFVANFQILGSSRNGPLKAYLDVARTICEMYDVHYIDLYNNDELTEALETDTLKYMDDSLHPNRPGYDIITPYIQAELERVMASIGDEQETTEQPGGDTTEPELDETTEIEPEGSDALTDGEGGASDEKSGCGSVVGTTGAVSVLAMLLPATLVLKKKKKESPRVC